MRNKFITAYTVIPFVALGFLVGSRAAAQQENAPEIGATNVIPLVVMENVPLHDAIRNLARQAGFNYILDPHILGSVTTADRRFVPEPTVSCRWSDLTASAALSRVLKVNKLKLVDNPSTTIARIAPVELTVEPLTAAQLGVDTNAAIPLIVMDEVPLRDAIRNLVQQLRLNITLDPTLSSRANEQVLSQEISIRWESVTARQALAALLDNYGLVLREDTATGSARIILKPKAKAP